MPCVIQDISCAMDVAESKNRVKKRRKRKQRRKSKVTKLDTKYHDILQRLQNVKPNDYDTSGVTISPSDYLSNMIVDCWKMVCYFLNWNDLVYGLNCVNKYHYVAISSSLSSLQLIDDTIYCKKQCDLNEFDSTTERPEKWTSNMSYKTKFKHAMIRRINFPFLVKDIAAKFLPEYNKSITSEMRSGRIRGGSGGVKILTMDDIFWPRLKKKDIKKFELKYKCKLPKDYILYLTKVSNGCIGPVFGCYGLNQLKETKKSYDDFDNKKRIKLLNIHFHLLIQQKMYLNKLMIIKI